MLSARRVSANLSNIQALNFKAFEFYTFQKANCIAGNSQQPSALWLFGITTLQFVAVAEKFKVGGKFTERNTIVEICMSLDLFELGPLRARTFRVRTIASSDHCELIWVEFAWLAVQVRLVRACSQCKLAEFGQTMAAIEPFVN